MNEETAVVKKIGSYSKIYNLGHYAIAELFNEEVALEEKVDGCFDYNTSISLDNGNVMPIGSIVNSRKNVNVLSFNFKEKVVESVSVLNYFRKSPFKNFIYFRIKGKGLSLKTSLKCTEDHLVFTKNGWKQAKDIGPGDILFRPVNKMSFVQEQIVIGCLLGDGCLDVWDNNLNKRYTTCHSIKQEEYIDLQKKIFLNFNPKISKQKSGYGSDMRRIITKSSYPFSKIANICYENGKKRICDNWLNLLTPISLASWFMDDGSRSSNGKQRDRVRFATNSFSEKEIDLIIDFFIKRYEFKCHKLKTKKGIELTLDSDSSEMFFHIVQPYIINCMKYKLPEHMRNYSCYWDNFEDGDPSMSLVETEILERENLTEKKVMYDIETKNNNYFAGKVLVHNSQFSFGMIGNDLKFRSKGAVIHVEAPPKMFVQGVEYVKSIAHLLHPDWIYRGEYLQKPKHNSLVYNRIPKNYIVIFDIDIGLQHYMSYEEKSKEADRLGLECVPLLKIGKFETLESFMELMESESFLGGPKIEGIVIKNYERFLSDGKVMMGKHVSEKFKERNQSNWKGKKQLQGDIKLEIGKSLKTEARWLKAIQHLRELDQLSNEPKDIGPLLKEINADILEEEKENIKEVLFKWAWKDISRIIANGFPEWYKEILAKRQFDEKESENGIDDCSETESPKSD